MISTAYVRTMAAYNSQVNARVYAAAERLTEDERRKDRGAFFRSIHGTLSHLVWADKAPASPPPDRRPKPRSSHHPPRGSPPSPRNPNRPRRFPRSPPAVAPKHPARTAPSTQEQAWYSAAAGREMRRSRALLVIHLFNHQTHHRGQVHAMLTAAGEASIVTDLPFIAK